MGTEVSGDASEGKTDSPDDDLHIEEVISMGGWSIRPQYETAHSESGRCNHPRINCMDAEHRDQKGPSQHAEPGEDDVDYARG